MKHAAHKAANDSRQRIHDSRTLFTPVSGSHSAKMVRVAQMASTNGALVGLEPAVADKLNEIAPQTRRAMREAARAAERRSHILVSASLAALVGTAATAVALNGPDELNGGLLASNTSTTTQLKRVSSSTVSRSEDRTSLSDTTTDAASTDDANAGTTAAVATADSDADTEQTTAEGQWAVGDSNTVDTDDLSRFEANNSVVAALMEEDYDDLPDGFNPNHATGDVGNAYEFSQCTWWVYVRRTQLGLPVGSYFGNGCMWANSASALGYWVDNTPRHVGDIMVFAAGQEGSSSTYGHVAIVEQINDDGSIVTSECGSAMNGETYSRTFTNTSDFMFIHY